LLIIIDYCAQLGALFAEDAMINICFHAVVMYVCVTFGAVEAVYRLFVAAFFPVVVLGAELAFLLVLAKPSSISKSKAFEASGY
jgi:hypothetical protein